MPDERLEPLNTFAHYSDARFSRGQTQTVFGPPDSSGHGHPGLHYDYSDRLWQWDHDKMKKSVEEANGSELPAKSAAWYEVMLSHFYGYEVELVHVVKGVNVSSGYDYQVFRTRKKTDSTGG